MITRPIYRTANANGTPDPDERALLAEAFARINDIHSRVGVLETE